MTLQEGFTIRIKINTFCLIAFLSFSISCGTVKFSGSDSSPDASEGPETPNDIGEDPGQPGRDRPFKEDDFEDIVFVGDDEFTLEDPDGPAVENPEIPIYQCQEIESPVLEPVVKYSWTSESSSHSEWKYPMSTPMVGDLTGDGVPEIVFVTFTTNEALADAGTHEKDGETKANPGYFGRGTLRVLNGKSGQEVGSLNRTDLAPFASASPLLIDMDGNGKAEIIYLHYKRKKMVALNHDLSLRWTLDLPNELSTSCMGGPAATNLNGDGRAEIVIDNAVIGEANGKGKLIASFSPVAQANCTSFGAPLKSGQDTYIINGAGAFNGLGRIAWSFVDGSNNVMAMTGASLAAAEIRPDLTGSEIVAVRLGVLHLFSSEGKLIWKKDLTGQDQCSASDPQTVGGAPTVGDFNGDGKIDIGMAAGTFYAVFDRDGDLLWKDDSTRDCSSSRTGSTLFDFNGDGKVETLYGDELFLRLYTSNSGQPLYEIPNPSGTLMESPVVVDVDGDGFSEIVAISNNYNGPEFYEDAGPLKDEVAAVSPGLRVFKAKAAYNWMPTRKVWNQYSYFVENISEDLSIRSVNSSEVKTFRQNLIGHVDSICKKE